MKSHNLPSAIHNLRSRAIWPALVLLAILLPIAYIMLNRPDSATAAPWFNGNYKHRTAYSFTATAAVTTERKVKIDVDTATLITAGKMQSDCDDIRFTDSTGKLLDYFIDTNTADCNNASTDFYVKVPSVAVGGNLIYMYYGNASITRSDLGGRKNDFFDEQGTSTALKGYWKMNETTANTCTGGVNDSCDSALTNDGAWNGDATTTTTAKLGGRAVTLDGVGDFIDSGTSTSLDPTTVTISAWVNTSDTGTGVDASTIVDKSRGAGAGSAYILSVGGRVSANAGKVVFEMFSGSWVAGASNTSVNDGQWHHVTATYDVSNIKIYIDGTLDNTIAQITAIPYNGTQNFYIGKYNSAGDAYFTGQIDNLKIYATPISGTQVSALYNSGNGREIPTPVTFTPSSGPTAASEETTPGPIAHWKFDEGQGQSINDNTLHNNDGTLGANSSSASDDPTWKQESDCVVGKCLQFDGTADYLNMPDNATLRVGASSFTTSLWFKAPNSNQFGPIYTKRLNTGNATMIGLYVGNHCQLGTSGKKLCFAFIDTNGTTYRFYSTQQDVADGKWHHVTVVNNSSTQSLTIYVDGISKALTLDSGNGGWPVAANTDPFRIGNNNATFYYQGFVDEFKIYPYARSAAEIRSDYSSGASVLGLADQKDYLSDGLVGYWKMDEAAANGCTGGINDSCDSSGNSNDGAWNGNTTSATGKFSNGTSFDGTGDYTSIADNSTLDLTTTITISAWIKTSDTIGAIFNHYNTLSPYAGFGFDIGTGAATDGALGFWSSGEGVWVGSTSTVNDNTWKHVAVTYSSTSEEAKFYINGSLNNTVTGVTIPGTSTNAASIGGFNDGTSSQLSGQIDDLRVYSRILSSDDIRNLYNWAPGPIAYWQMDESAANTCTGGVKDSCDTSGNGKDGTWNGNTTKGSGKYGNGTTYDGASDSITAVSFASQSTGTFALWVKPTVISTNGGFINTDGTDFDIFQNVGSLLYFRGGSGAGQQSVSIASWTANTWHHVALSWDGTSFYGYIDGVRVATGSQSGSLSGTITLGTVDGSYYFNGSMDDVRVYNYARTAGQVVEDMNAGHPLGGSPVGSQTVQYKFDEQQGTTANNNSSLNSAITGTISGATWKTKENCKINGCLDFDGTDDVVTVTNADAIDLNVNLASGFTMSAWIYPDAAGEGTGGEILYKGTNTWLRVDTLSGGKLDIEASLDLATADATLNATAKINQSAWNHVAVGYTDDADDEITIWVNGIAVGSSTSGSGAPAADTANLLIGGNTTNNFDGKIDHFNIYNSELSVDNIRIDMTANSAVSYSVLGSSEAADLSDGAGNPPVAEWKLDDKTGTSAVDTSGNGNTGTLTSGPTWESAGKCKEGACLSFDGNDDYVNVSNSSSLQITGAITASAWVKTSSLGSGGGILSKSLNAQKYFGVSSQKVYELGVLSTDLYWQISTGTTARALSTNFSSYIDGRWHHVLATWDGTTGSTAMKIYIDGRLITSGAATGITAIQSTTDALDIGGYTTAYNWNGQIDGVKIYNYARTQAQVAYDYNRGKPVGWWKMDECQGSTAYDASGNSNNGTITLGASGTQTSVGTCTTSSTAWGNGATGKYSSSLNFDGTDDYIDLGTPSTLSVPTDKSVFAWVKTNSVANGRKVIIGQYNAAGNNGHYSLEIDGTEIKIFNAVLILTTTNANLATGTWYHLGLTVSGSTWTIYKNGVALATTTSSPNATQLTTAIGRPGAYNGLYFTGQIDDVRIYNYALSASQVKTLMNEGSGVRYGN